MIAQGHEHLTQIGGRRQIHAGEVEHHEGGYGQFRELFEGCHEGALARKPARKDGIDTGTKHGESDSLHLSHCKR